MLTFAAPAFLWGLLALPLVILLHRIRVRRERREVAGGFLWRRARDAGARRPRMRASLLLLLQLLAIAGLTLAAAGPRWSAEGPPLAVLVIDASASMAARDGVTSPVGRELATLSSRATRLDAARARAETLLGGGGPVAIVRGGLEPRLLLAPTSDTDEVRRVLSEIVAVDARDDPSRALRLARDVAEAVGAAEIHWLSDSPPPATAGVRTHPLAGEGRNVGVTGFELVAGQAWVRVSSDHPVPLELPIEIRRGETRVASTTLIVPARGDAATSFPVGGGTASLQASVSAPADDVLALDDEAWAGAPTVRVALDRGFSALERALNAIDDVDVRVSSAAATLPADLRILQHGRFGDAPDGPTLLLPPRDAPAVGATVERWDASDPLLRFVDLRDLRVAYLDPAPFGEEEGWTTLAYGVVDTIEEEPVEDEPVEDEPFEDAPAEEEPEEEEPVEEVPVDDAPSDDEQGDERTGDEAAGDEAAGDAADGAVAVPLLQRRDRPTGPIWRSAFHPVRGDLTLRPAFPTLIVNLVDRVRGEDRVALGSALPAGANRDGSEAPIADRPGPFRVGGRTVHASLLAENETRLPRPEAFAVDGTGAGGAGSGGSAADRGASASEGDDRAAAERGGVSRRDLSVLLIVLAGALLALEWWGWSGAPIPGISELRARRADRATRRRDPRP